MTKQEKREKENKGMLKDIFDRLEKYIIAAVEGDKFLEAYIRGVFALERNYFGVDIEELSEQDKREKEMDEIIVYLMTMHGYCKGKAEFFAEDIVDYIFNKIDEKKE